MQQPVNESETGISYWPFATHRKANGTLERLFTYDSVPTKEKALDTIKDWADHYNYHLISAEIKVSKIGRDDLSTWIRVF